MVVSIPSDAVSSSSEQTLLDDAALSDAAATSDAVTAAPLESETEVTPNSTPTSAVLDEDEMVAYLEDLLEESDVTGAFTAFMLSHVRDNASMTAFAIASQRAYLSDVLEECGSDVGTAAATLSARADSFGPFFTALAVNCAAAASPSSTLFALLAADPALATNALAFELGFLEGMSDSKIASADALFDLLETNATLTVLMPIHAACFLAGTIYQFFKNIYDVVELIIEAIGYADELLPMACRMVAALPRALGRLLDSESADDVALLGQLLGQMLGNSVQSKIPSLSSSTSFAQAAADLITFSFECGKFFGPLILDIFLSVIGIGYIEGALLLLDKTVSCTTEVLDALFTFLRKLFDAIDSTLVDDLIAFGAKVASALAARFATLAADAERLYGIAADEVNGGVEMLKDVLGREGFEEYAATIFCTLEGA